LLALNPNAWDAWLAGLPESKNVEDRTGYDPTREAAMAYRDPVKVLNDAFEAAFKDEKHKKNERKK
jgi:hypothetical protein